MTWFQILCRFASIAFALILVGLWTLGLIDPTIGASDPTIPPPSNFGAWQITLIAYACVLILPPRLLLNNFIVACCAFGFRIAGVLLFVVTLILLIRDQASSWQAFSFLLLLPGSFAVCAALAVAEIWRPTRRSKGRAASGASLS